MLFTCIVYCTVVYSVFSAAPWSRRMNDVSFKYVRNWNDNQSQMEQNVTCQVPLEVWENNIASIKRYSPRKKSSIFSINFVHQKKKHRTEQGVTVIKMFYTLQPETQLELFHNMHHKRHHPVFILNTGMKPGCIIPLIHSDGLLVIH